MRCLFLSDAHYPLSKRIVDFLLYAYYDYDAIYILGDLFEFFYGYKDFFYSHHLPLLNALSMIAEKRKVVLIEGNHEYALENIKQFIKAEIVPSFADIEIDGLKIHIGHGDTIDKKDLGYRLFRAFLKNPVTLSAIEHLNPACLLELSKRASEFSKRGLASKGYRRVEEALERYACDRIERYGYDAVILGHTHTPRMKKCKNGLYINTGDFFEHYSYVTYAKGIGFRINFFSK